MYTKDILRNLLSAGDLAITAHRVANHLSVEVEFGLYKYCVTIPSFIANSRFTGMFFFRILNLEESLSFLVDLYKQLKPRRSATIIHYAPPALLRVVDSLRHNHAFYALLIAPKVNHNLRFEDILRCITYIQNKKDVHDNILYTLVCGILGNC